MDYVERVADDLEHSKDVDVDNVVGDGGGDDKRCIKKKVAGVDENVSKKGGQSMPRCGCYDL